MEYTLDPTLRCMGLLLLPWSRIVWEVCYSDPSSGATVKITVVVGPNTHKRGWLLTDKTSDTWNQSPVAFRP